MRIAFFYPSLIEDSECGTSNFIRGIITQLAEDGDEVKIFQPSTQNHQNSTATPTQNQNTILTFPLLNSSRIQILSIAPHPVPLIELEQHLEQIDLVLVHEQSSALLIHTLGELRKNRAPFRLFFHDHLHKILTNPTWILSLNLKHFDGVLTSRTETQRMYLNTGLTRQAWVWKEAIRTDEFKPTTLHHHTIETLHAGIKTRADYESPELQDCILSALKEMNLGIRLYGSYTVRPFSIEECRAHIYLRGKAHHARMPEIYSQSRVTFSTQQAPSQRCTPHLPSMRLLEALACGTPLISTPWEDTENLFTPGQDYLLTHHKDETKELVRLLLSDSHFRGELTQHARQTILNHFSTQKRAQELRVISQSLSLCVKEDCVF